MPLLVAPDVLVAAAPNREARVLREPGHRFSRLGLDLRTEGLLFGVRRGREGGSPATPGSPARRRARRSPRSRKSRRPRPAGGSCWRRAPVPSVAGSAPGRPGSRNSRRGSSSRPAPRWPSRSRRSRGSSRSRHAACPAGQNATRCGPATSRAAQACRSLAPTAGPRLRAAAGGRTPLATRAQLRAGRPPAPRPWPRAPPHASRTAVPIAASTVSASLPSPARSTATWISTLALATSGDVSSAGGGSSFGPAGPVRGGSTLTSGRTPATLAVRQRCR